MELVREVNAQYLERVKRDNQTEVTFKSPVLRFNGDNYFVRFSEKSPSGESKDLCCTLTESQYDSLVRTPNPQLNKPEEKA